MQNNTRFARSATFAAILGLTMTTGALGAVAPMAYAQPAGPSGSPIVNPEAQGNLTIHKRQDPETLGTPTGDEDDTVVGQPLQGAGFTIYRINDITLTTNEGLAAASGVTAAEYADLVDADGNPTSDRLTAVGQEQTTGANGQISYPNL